MLRVLCACIAAACGSVLAAPASEPAPVRAGVLVGKKVDGLGLAGSARIDDLRLTPDARRIAAFVIAADGRTMDCAFAPITSSADSVRLQPPDGRGCVPPARGAGALALSDALKAHVRDRQREVVGSVKDFYIDPRTGEVTHTITEFDPDWYKSKGWVALPSSGLSLDQGDFVARFRKDDMRAAGDGGASTAAAPAPAAPPAVRRVDVRVSQWLGRVVKDDEGHALGKVVDLWLDPARRRGAVASVMPERGGSAMACRIGPHGLQPKDDGFLIATEPPERGAPCAASPAALEPSAKLESAKAILGSRIRSTDGDDVGAVRDVVLRADDGEVHYLLADFSSAWVQDGKLMILPSRPLRRDEHGTWIQASLLELQRFPMVGEERVGDVSAASFANAVDGYLAKGQ